MRYVVLLAAMPEGITWEGLGEAGQQSWMERHAAFDDACRTREGVRIEAAEALGEGDLATTVSTGPDGSLVLTDGPFTEAAEQIGGFYLVEVPDFDVLVELLAELPPYLMDIRPVVDP